MKEICVRRRITLRAFAVCAGLAMLPAGSFARAQSTPMKIGIIGSGNIGGTLGVLWAKAGHQVLFSSRHPDELVDLVNRAGASARAGMPREAAAFGDVVLISIPYVRCHRSAAIWLRIWQARSCWKRAIRIRRAMARWQSLH